MREHFKELMFDCHVPHAAPMVHGFQDKVILLIGDNLRYELTAPALGAQAIGE
jgi:hypothetical protein